VRNADYSRIFGGAQVYFGDLAGHLPMFPLEITNNGRLFGKIGSEV
jgi:hypothetical protein